MGLVMGRALGGMPFPVALFVVRDSDGSCHQRSLRLLLVDGRRLTLRTKGAGAADPELEDTKGGHRGASSTSAMICAPSARSDTCPK